MQTIDFKQKVKMSERDSKILRAMVSNLFSFIEDARAKGGEIEMDLMFHVEQCEQAVPVKPSDFDKACSVAFSGGVEFNKGIEKMKEELFRLGSQNE